MFIGKKTIMGFLALVLLLPLSLLGCTSDLSAEEITANVIDAYQKVTTTRMDMTLNAATEMTTTNQSIKFNMLENAVASINVAEKQMEMAMNITMDMPGQGTQDMAMDVFVISDWIYMKVGLPQGDQWLRMRLSDELWSQQDQLTQQIEFLKTAIKVTSLGSETVDGVDCFVVQIKPDMESLMKWLSSQQSQPGVDFSKIDLSRVFKSTSIKEWIAQDSYLPVKAEMDMVLEMLPEDVGATDQDFTKMAMDIKAEVRYYDYNQPVSVALPLAALDAQEITTGQ
ncbi:MAG: DUF6612 family protein [Chloroflexota bacterium]